MTIAETLTEYGMKRIGTVQIVDDRFTIDLLDIAAAQAERCIYAFVVGDEILRIGSSKGKLQSRLKAWQSDVSNALANRKFRTPVSEAEIWRSTLAEHGTGHLYAREGTKVRTPVGEFNMYLTEESALINRHEPRCCNDVPRHRSRQP